MKGDQKKYLFSVAGLEGKGSCFYENVSEPHLEPFLQNNLLMEGQQILMQLFRGKLKSEGGTGTLRVNSFVAPTEP